MSNSLPWLSHAITSPEHGLSKKQLPRKAACSEQSPTKRTSALLPSAVLPFPARRVLPAEGEGNGTEETQPMQWGCTQRFWKQPKPSDNDLLATLFILIFSEVFQELTSQDFTVYKALRSWCCPITRAQSHWASFGGFPTSWVNCCSTDSLFMTVLGDFSYQLLKPSRAFIQNSSRLWVSCNSSPNLHFWIPVCITLKNPMEKPFVIKCLDQLVHVNGIPSWYVISAERLTSPWVTQTQPNLLCCCSLQTLKKASRILLLLHLLICSWDTSTINKNFLARKICHECFEKTGSYLCCQGSPVKQKEAEM